MRPQFAIVAVLFVLVISAPQLGQALTPDAKAAGPMSYDASEEVTLNGTVAAVLTTPLPEMLAGSHLLLTTPSGSVDVSLGTTRVRGKDEIALSAGQQVEVTGVMKIFRGNQVFLARTVKTGGSLYEIRNEHGIPVTPHARQRMSQILQSGDKQ